RPISIVRSSVPVLASPREPTVADVAAIMEDVRDAFGNFRAANDQRVGELETELRELNARMALAGHGGVEFDGLTARKERELFAAHLRNPIQAAMSTDSKPDGGYLVPRTVSEQITTLAREMGVMRRLAS